MKLRKALDKANQSRQKSQGEHDSVAIAPVGSQTSTIALDLAKLKENKCVCFASDAPEVQMYKVLRTQIQQRTKEKGWNTVMITSALPGEGKTHTSINLAFTFAKEIAQTVLLVDCDLKRQDIHKRLGVRSPKGLIDYLVDDCSMEELMIRPDIDNLSFISGGRTIHDSTELLGSPKMKALVAEMKNRYQDRYVFFEVPPVLFGADAVAFAPLVDCILFVVEAGRTSVQSVRKALELLPEEKVLGCVLNRLKSSQKEYAAYNYAYK
jgi:non-specific protein-tyrosine kinase